MKLIEAGIKDSGEGDYSKSVLTADRYKNNKGGHAQKQITSRYKQIDMQNQRIMLALKNKKSNFASERYKERYEHLSKVKENIQIFPN
jgi:hypothetical protein